MHGNGVPRENGTDQRPAPRDTEETHAKPGVGETGCVAQPARATQTTKTMTKTARHKVRQLDDTPGAELLRYQVEMEQDPAKITGQSD